MKTAPSIRKINLAIAGLLLSLNLLSQTQNIAWALNSFTFGSACNGLGLAVDHNNNVYTSGYFQYETVFGSNTLAAQGGASFFTYDIFLSKVNPSGNPVSSQNFGGDYDDYGYDIFVDGAGNQYLGGGYNSTMSFGSHTLIGQTPVASEAFLCKLDPVGNVLWAKQHVSVGTCLVQKVLVNSSGEIYTFGSYSNLTSVGSASLTSNGSIDIFLAKYTSAGSLIWLKGFGGPQLDYPGSMAIDASGNVCISGTFASSMTINQTTLISSGSTDGFLAKIDPNGNSVWVKKIGGPGADLHPDVTIDYSGNIYSVGKFATGLSYFDNTPLIATGTYDAFVTKFDSHGNLIWVKKFSPTLYSDWVSARDIAVDKFGGIYIAGELSGTVQFTNGSVPSATLSSVNGGGFILKLHPNGSFLWFKQIDGGSGYTNYFENVVASPNGDVYAQLALSSMGQIENYILPVAGMGLLKFEADPSVGLNEQHDDNFVLIYPNPSSDFIKIEHEYGDPICSYTLYDSQGREIQTSNQLNLVRKELDIRAL